MRYAVVIEQDETSFGAYVPDLPGCVAAGDPFPEPTSSIEFVEVAA
jgi:predicted RNase H-like HicB family nuclease